MEPTITKLGQQFPRCQQVMAGGQQCQQPAKRGMDLCAHHDPNRIVCGVDGCRRVVATPGARCGAHKQAADTAPAAPVTVAAAPAAPEGLAETATKAAIIDAVARLRRVVADTAAELINITGALSALPDDQPPTSEAGQAGRLVVPDRPRTGIPPPMQPIQVRYRVEERTEYPTHSAIHLHPETPPEAGLVRLPETIRFTVREGEQLGGLQPNDRVWVTISADPDQVPAPRATQEYDRGTAQPDIGVRHRGGW